MVLKQVNKTILDSNNMFEKAGRDKQSLVQLIISQ